MDSLCATETSDDRDQENRRWSWWVLNTVAADPTYLCALVNEASALRRIAAHTRRTYGMSLDIRVAWFECLWSTVRRGDSMMEWQRGTPLGSACSVSPRSNAGEVLRPPRPYSLSEPQGLT